jgi:hypothetical protein
LISHGFDMIVSTNLTTKQMRHVGETERHLYTVEFQI